MTRLIAYGDDNLPTPRPRQVAPANLVRPHRRRTGAPPPLDAAQPPPAAEPPAEAPHNRLPGSGALAGAGPRRYAPSAAEALQLQPDAGGVGASSRSATLRDGLAYSPSAARRRKRPCSRRPSCKTASRARRCSSTSTNKGYPRQGRGPFRTDPGVQPRLVVLPGPGVQFTPNEQIGRTGKGLPYGVPIIQHRDDDNSGGSGYRLQIEDGDLWVYIAHSRPANMIALKDEEAAAGQGVGPHHGDLRRVEPCSWNQAVPEREAR